MMRLLSVISIVLLWAANVTVAGESTSRHPDQLTLAPLALTLPAPVDTMLSNGIRVLFFENHDVPVVTVTAHVAMGSLYLPPEELAAYDLFSRLWDDGGAGELAPEAFEKRVAALGMNIRATAGHQEGTITAFMAREDLDDGLPLWRDLLLAPRLDADRLDRARAQLVKDLQGINDNPGRLARTWFRRLLHGPDTPGGITHSRESIEAVDRDDLVAIHQRSVQPVRTVIGVAGDLDLTEALARLESLLAGWQGDADLPPLVAWSWQSQPRPGVYLLPGDFEQCHLRLGRSVAGLTHASPDYALARVASFGVGYLRVYYRTRQAGLSYGTATLLDIDPDRAAFIGFGSTRPDQIVELIETVREEIATLATEPLDENELKSSQNFLLGSTLESLETANDVVDSYVSDIVTGRPAGFQRDQVASIQAVTTEDLTRAVSQWIDLGEALVVLVVGEPQGGAASLEALGLGPVTVLEPVRFGY